MPYYHVSSFLLAPDSIILPGNWGQIVRSFGWQHNFAFKEAALEHVRSMEFPGKPSRLDCAFVLNGLEDANAYYYEQQPDQLHTVHVMYEVELVDSNAAMHEADWHRTSPSGPINLEWARAYWRGDRHPGVATAHREILTLSPLRILSTVMGRAPAPQIFR